MVDVVVVDDELADAVLEGRMVELPPNPQSCGTVSTLVTGLQPGRLVKLPVTCSEIGSAACGQSLGKFTSLLGTSAEQAVTTPPLSVYRQFATASSKTS